MSERGPEVLPTDTRPLLGDDEIDLRQIVHVLLQWHREIIALCLIAFLCATLAGVTRNAAAKTLYEALATVAIARVESNVNFDPNFTTASQSTEVDARARRAALLGLTASGAVAEAVSKELGSTLGADERDPGRLIKSVRAVISSQDPYVGKSPASSDLNSDLIQIIAQADSPSKAAAIANAWAKAYVDQVNLIYSQASTNVSPSVAAQLAQARTDYQAAESKLQAFLAGSKIDETQWQITSLHVQIADAYDAYSATSRLLSSARTMRAQVATGGEGAAVSNAAALQLLKVQAFGQLDSNHPVSEWESGNVSQDSSESKDSRDSSNSAAPREILSQDQPRRPQSASTLQLQLPTLTQLSATNMLADLDGLIQSLEDKQSALAVQISALSDALLPASASAAHASQSNRTDSSSSLSGTIGALQSRLRELDSKLEGETARKQELTQERDLAWNTYKTLNSKVAELKVAQAAADSEVRFATPALPPAEPILKRNPLLLAVLGGAVGLALGACVALFANYLGLQPLFSRRGKHQRLEAGV